MIEIWVKNHLVSDIKCNNVNQYAQFVFYKEWQIIFRLTFSVGDTTPGVTISIEQDNSN